MEPQRENSLDHLAGIRDVNYTSPLGELTQQIVNKAPVNNNQETNSTHLTDVKPFRCCVNADRLNHLRKKVEDSIRERKTFTIKGGFHCIRNALLHRGWVEKIEVRSPTVKVLNLVSNPPSMDEVCANLPPKQDWESIAAHIAKCEKMIISRLLMHHDVDFYWNLRKDGNEWQQRLNKNKIINRFSRSLFTSKEGLCLLLQQMYWHNEPGVAFVRFPRCYTINFADQCQAFIEDFRITACMSLLRWFIYKVQKDGEMTMFTADGRVPITAIQFAIDRCNEYISVQKHLDLDRDFHKVWDHEWQQFLTNFQLMIHDGEAFSDNLHLSIPSLEIASKTALKNIVSYWPQYELDGFKNIWIMKPGNKCRGRDIMLIKDVNDVIKAMNNKLKYVVQKYVERPLLIHKTKFDIRQWFLVTCVQPLTVWMYRDCYLRFSSQKFCLDNFHESVHLTNHAVQHKYTVNEERDKALPDDNMWDNHTFKAYLRQIGQSEKWYKIIYPGMRESIIGAMLASQDTMDRRPNTFELYGADFMIAENFTPWLIEINSCPAMGPTTSVTARMCPQCFEDILKVVVDRRRDPKAETGLFELIYRQNLPQSPAYLGMTLSIRGRKIFKKKNSGKQKYEKTEKYQITNNENKPRLRPQYKPQLHVELVKNYKGPVIGNLIEELHDTLFKNSAEIEELLQCPDFSFPQDNPQYNGNYSPPLRSNSISPTPITKTSRKGSASPTPVSRSAAHQKAAMVQDFQLISQKPSVVYLTKQNTNKRISSLDRKQNGKERTGKNFNRKKSSVRKPLRHKSHYTNRTMKTSPYSPEDKWQRGFENKNSTIQKKRLNWEQETASILKGNIVLSSAPVYTHRVNKSKSSVHVGLIKNCSLSTVNKALPEIESKTGSQLLTNNLLTVGLGYKNK